MSAVPVTTRVREQDRQRRVREADVRERNARGTQVRRSVAKKKGQSRRQSSTFSFCLQQIFWCAFVVMVTYGFSILLGSSMMENARRDKVKAVSRMKEARADMVQVRNRMDRLTTMAAVDTWARSRGFVPPHGLTIEMEPVVSPDARGGEGVQRVASGVVAQTSGETEDGA